MQQITRLFLWILFIPLFFSSLSTAQNADHFPQASPESQGIPSALLEELSDQVQLFLDRDHIVGAELLVIKNRRTVLHQTFGWLDREKHKAMVRDSIFNVRSMTKPITGAAIQILIDEGKLKLSDRASNYIPGFSGNNTRSITIEQLLTHRSGLPLSTLTALDEYDDLYTMANSIGENGTQFHPGTKFWYSDAGTEVLGAIVEVVSGIPLDQFIRERLLEPLGMADSFSYSPTPGNESMWDRVGSIYYWLNRDSWIKIWQSDGTPFYPFAWGSQTLYSTPKDYARFIAMWMDKGLAGERRILSEEAVTRSLTPVSFMTSLGQDSPMPTGFSGLTTCYGQMSISYLPSDKGITGAPVIIGHDGSDGTNAWGYPEQDLIVMYFTQSRGGLTVIRLETDIGRLLINHGVEPEIPDEYRPYVGDYSPSRTSSGDDIFSIFYHNGRLGLDYPGIFILQLNDPDSNGRWYNALDHNVYVMFDYDEIGEVKGMRCFEPGLTRRFNKIQPTSVSHWSLFE